MPETTETITPIDVVAACPTCGEIRYHSIKPVGGREDCIASNFAPVGDAPALPDGSAPICYVCQSLLTFAPADKFKKHTPAVTVAKTAEEVPVRVRAQETERDAVETLFEVGRDEQVLDVRQSTAELAMVVITNKRIVKVRL